MALQRHNGEHMTEKWKPIAGFDGAYEVSNQGRVRPVGKAPMSLSRPTKSRRYCSVTLTYAGACKTFLVHRLVAAAFVPARPGCEVVNHKNGNREDNTALNLEWCTPTENARHARDVLGKKPGASRSVRADFADGRQKTWPSQRAAERELVGQDTGIVSWALKNQRSALGAAWSRP